MKLILIDESNPIEWNESCPNARTLSNTIMIEK
jgi:hypothetical protein